MRERGDALRFAGFEDRRLFGRFGDLLLKTFWCDYVGR